MNILYLDKPCCYDAFAHRIERAFTEEFNTAYVLKRPSSIDEKVDLVMADMPVLQQAMQYLSQNEHLHTESAFEIPLENMGAGIYLPVNSSDRTRLIIYTKELQVDLLYQQLQEISDLDHFFKFVGAVKKGDLGNHYLLELKNKMKKQTKEIPLMQIDEAFFYGFDFPGKLKEYRSNHPNTNMPNGFNFGKQHPKHKSSGEGSQ